ncbi:MAG: glutathione S-transferase family protein [Alphaproteobacteria bacterium]|nr:glutathione S-transferase family protein [Alphaproteobacteria bacterium]
MARLVLVIANKAYSSWSMRGWLALKATGEPFDEVVIPLDRPDTRERILRYSPSAKVPVLVDGDVRVWESLAIGEYLAEKFPAARLWPEEIKARALARAVSAEMHAGFMPLRRTMPMNCRVTYEARPIKDPELAADIARIEALWADCRTRFGSGGPYLFGRYTLADAMFAPVVNRFTTYQVPVSAVTAAYMKAIHAHPHVAEWVAGAQAETVRIDKYEAAPN